MFAHQHVTHNISVAVDLSLTHVDMMCLTATSSYLKRHRMAEGDQQLKVSEGDTFASDKLMGISPIREDSRLSTVVV